MVYPEIDFYATYHPEQHSTASLSLKDTKFMGSRPLEVDPERFFQVMIYQSQDVMIKDCHFENSSNGVFFIQNSRVNITKSKFINNQQSDRLIQTGVVHFWNSSAFISGCIFDNNIASLMPGGTIRFDEVDSIYKNDRYIVIHDTIIKGGILSDSEIFEDSIISIQSINLTFQGFVHISCPANYRLIHTLPKNHGQTNFQVFCKKCDRTTYSLDLGHITWNKTKKSFDHQNITCTPCPFGGVCQERIKSKGNYWGYKTENIIKFVYCPSSYCCSSPLNCSSFDTCYHNRHKTLCSECLQNYSVELLGQNRCIESVSCSKFYFWIIYIFLIVFYTLFFMYMQEVFLSIKRKLQKLARYCQVVESDVNLNQQDEGIYFVSADPDMNVNENGNVNDVNENQQDEGINSVSVDLDELSFQMVPNHSEGTMEYPEETYQFSGIIKTLFFFYQTASIIRVNSPTKGQYPFPKFVDIILSFFNVKIDIDSTYNEICPFKNSDVIHVDIIRSGILIVCPFILFLIAAAWSMYQKTLTRSLPLQQLTEIEKDSRYVFNIDDRLPHYAKLPFIVRIKCAYIQLLLIGFASIAVLLFKMIHCIEINGEKCLYVKATVICFTRLQKIVMVIVASWVVPFCLSLSVSCHLLRIAKLHQTNLFL